MACMPARKIIALYPVHWYVMRIAMVTWIAHGVESHATPSRPIARSPAFTSPKLSPKMDPKSTAIATTLVTFGTK